MRGVRRALDPIWQVGQLCNVYSSTGGTKRAVSSKTWQKLAALPDTTTVYCAHEYTVANAAFAVSIDPDNDVLQTRVQKITALRADGKPTVPTQIGLERATNPFLRPHDARIRAQLHMAEAADVDVFAEIRARKDNF